MNKGIKYLVGFFSFLILCGMGIGLYKLWLVVLDYNQPFLTMGPDSVRDSTAATLYMVCSILGTGAILFVVQLYNNVISFITLSTYLHSISKQESVKFLARMKWFSNLPVQEYYDNKYLIHRLFYPQADLLQKGKKGWILKIKFKPIELVLRNKLGKLIYYEEKILQAFVIKLQFSRYIETIQTMVYFLQENYSSDLTDAQINNKLDTIFLFAHPLSI